MIDCCPMAAGDCDEVMWSTERFCTARQPHVCCECGLEITPGERMHLLRMLVAGDFSIWKTCPTCAIMRKELSCDEGYYLGQMRPLLMKYYGIDYVTGESPKSASGQELWYDEEMRRYRDLGMEAV